MKTKLKSRQQVANFLLADFDIQGQVVDFIPGQFFNLTLINPPYTDNRGNSRKFGFTNSTLQTEVSMMTKMGVSAFKKSLLEIPIGSEVEIDGIDGHNHLPNDINQQFVWVADSIGIAPFLSIAREIKKKSLENKVALIYVCKTAEEAICTKEFEDEAKILLSFKFIPVFSETNSIDINILKNLPDFQTSQCVITGEQNFVVPNFKLITEIGVEVKNIAMEIFTGY